MFEWIFKFQELVDQGDVVRANVLAELAKYTQLVSRRVEGPVSATLWRPAVLLQNVENNELISGLKCSRLSHGCCVGCRAKKGAHICLVVQ